MAELRLNTIPELIGEIAAGRMVILMDDEDRENEGDLIMAASLTRPEDINFMARYGRGLICLPLTRERCAHLRLPLMVDRNAARFGTNFTVSIEARTGITTGISAQDRAHTIRTAVHPDAQAGDLVQPGHIFPLMAHPGGVLARAGHTEAGIDLAVLAGLDPSAVLVEILNEDGTMARGPQLEIFARQHGLMLGTIADLIRYRLENERTVERVAQRQVMTEHGPFELHTYRDGIEGRLHLALLRGQPRADQPMLVRVQVQNPLSDVLGIQREDFGMPLRLAMAEIARAGSGLVLVLGGHDDDSTLLRRIQEQPEPAISVSGDNQRSRELRTYGIGAQIIADLGIRRMRVLGAPTRFLGLSGFGLEVVDYVEPVSRSSQHD